MVRSARVRLSSLAVLASFFLPGVTLAQSSPGSTAVPAGIESGKVIRARIGPDRTLVGSYVPVGDGRLGIRSELGATDTLRLDQIRELAVRGRHTKTGAIVGGLAGVGFGIFIGLMVTGLCETEDCEGARPYLIAIPAFGAGGALVGAAVGSAFPKWKRVLP